MPAIEFQKSQMTSIFLQYDRKTMVSVKMGVTGEMEKTERTGSEKTEKMGEMVETESTEKMEKMENRD